jgi:hypothetical protein
MLAAITSLWEPLAVIVAFIGVAGGAARWIIERLEKRFDRVDRQLALQSRRLDRLERQAGLEELVG